MAIFFECLICGWDSDEAEYLSSESGFPGICWHCFTDCGHQHELSERLASDEEQSRLKVVAGITYG